MRLYIHTGIYIPVELLFNTVLSFYLYIHKFKIYVIYETFWFELKIVASENKAAIKMVIIFHFVV